MPALPGDHQAWSDTLRHWLRGGVVWTEYDLLCALAADTDLIDADFGGDNFRLFQVHFSLFHHLYRLRETLHAEGSGTLWIGPLRIQWQALTDSDRQGLAERDPLRDYYLDAEQLARTDRAEVERLLGDFFRRLAAPPATDAALAELDLPADADWPTIKRAYRRKAQQLHPDRGGDGEALKRLNAAMVGLRRHYQR